MIGEKTMKDLRERILIQTINEAKEFVERDLNIFFNKVRKLKKEQEE